MRTGTAGIYAMAECQQRSDLETSKLVTSPSRALGQQKWRDDVRGSVESGIFISIARVVASKKGNNG